MHQVLQVLIIVGCVALGCDTTWAQGRSAKAAAKKQVEPDFLPGYKYREILAFKLLINNQVLEENEKSEDKRKPLEVLELELGMLAHELPPRAVNVLRNEIGFWVEWDKVIEVSARAPKGGRAVACYHPGDNKLHRYAFRSVESKVKSNAVEILSMKLLTAEHQGTRHRSVLLHEITHAVHHHLFDYDNPHIIAAYRNAMANGLYSGQYASSDPMEYFAEVTCAYFGHLHYQPHNRDELKEYDQRGYDMMEKVWGDARSDRGRGQGRHGKGSHSQAGHRPSLAGREDQGRRSQGSPRSDHQGLFRHQGCRRRPKAPRPRQQPQAHRQRRREAVRPLAA